MRGMVLVLWGIVVWASAAAVVPAVAAAEADRILPRGPHWYGDIPDRPGDERFRRLYVDKATLYHEDGREVALWGVNMQACMSAEYQRYMRIVNKWSEFDPQHWKAVTDATFDEIERMGCDVIRTHLCPADFSDAEGNLVENEWLDMVDYVMAECRRRGIYIYFTLFNHWGGVVEESPFHGKVAQETKWEWIVRPDYLAAGENFVRQFVNRRNPYDGDRPYKHNPAWIIAELINEPMFPKEPPLPGTHPEATAVYRDWCAEQQLPPGEVTTWNRFRYAAMRAYIDRMDRLLYEQKVPAVPCWNLYWSKGPIHQGWEGYQAAADSTVPVVSFSTYPGQDLSKVDQNQHQRNLLPYIQQSYDNADWQGWLRDPRFLGRKARIVYEYETWHNQSTYLYPALAKYFRSQGAQIACMWTYNMHGEGRYMGKSRSHNLSLITTPRKAASFIVAGEIFRKTPRFIPYSTTAADADRFGHAALSLPRDLSAWADDDVFVHTGDIGGDFVPIPENPGRIIGYGSSPFVEYAGKGLYFLVRTGPRTWNLEVMPHAEFTDIEPPAEKPPWGEPIPPGVEIDETTAVPMTLRLPGVNAPCTVHRIEGEARILVPASFKNGALRIEVVPGRYQITARRDGA